MAHQFVTIQAASTKHFLSAEGGNLHARDKLTDHTTWELETLPHHHKHGEEVAFKSADGHYLSMNSHGQVHLSKERKAESHFLMEKLSDGDVTLKGQGDYFLSSGKDHSKHCIGNLPGKTEHFTLEKQAHHNHHNHGHTHGGGAH